MAYKLKTKVCAYVHVREYVAYTKQDNGIHGMRDNDNQQIWKRNLEEVP